MTMTRTTHQSQSSTNLIFPLWNIMLPSSCIAWAARLFCLRNCNISVKNKHKVNNSTQLPLRVALAFKPVDKTLSDDLIYQSFWKIIFLWCCLSCFQLLNLWINLLCVRVLPCSIFHKMVIKITLYSFTWSYIFTSLFSWHFLWYW